MNERLIQFLAAENMTQAQFADSINVARASVSHIVQGRNNPGWDFIVNTMNRYPTLNIEWLLTGKGKMYKAAVNEVRNAVSNTLFGDDYADRNEARAGDEGGIFDSETVELSDPAPQQTFQQVAQPASQAAMEPVSQPVSQSAPLASSRPAPSPASGNARQTDRQGAFQPAGLPYSVPQNVAQNVVNKPNVIKVIVFFEDGTFQECE